MAETLTYWTDIAWRGWKHILHYAEAYQTLLFAGGWTLFFAKFFLSKLRKDVDILDLKSYALRSNDPKVIEMVEWFNKKQEEEKRKAC